MSSTDKEWEFFHKGQIVAFKEMVKRALYEIEDLLATQSDVSVRPLMREYLQTLLRDDFPEREPGEEIPVVVDAPTTEEKIGVYPSYPYDDDGSRSPLVRLESDFHDWYDYQFSQSWQSAKWLYKRHAESSMSRQEAFRLLSSLGLPVIPHGTPKEVSERTGKDVFTAVVYQDSYAHRGEGKVLVESNRVHPKSFCSLYMGTGKDGPSSSFRHLQVGRRYWGINYHSSNDWRSNCGDVIWEVRENYIDTMDLREEMILTRNSSFLAHPVWSIDFVSGYAVDFNTAPGLAPIQGCISAKDVVGLIAEHFEQHGWALDKKEIEHQDGQ